MWGTVTLVYRHVCDKWSVGERGREGVTCVIICLQEQGGLLEGDDMRRTGKYICTPVCGACLRAYAQ